MAGADRGAESKADEVGGDRNANDVGRVRVAEVIWMGGRVVGGYGGVVLENADTDPARSRRMGAGFGSWTKAER